MKKPILNLTAFGAVLILATTPFPADAQAPAIEWEKSYGGSDEESGIPNLAEAHSPSVLQTNDGGYIFAATTKSNDGDITVNNGGKDIWVVKTDAMGVIQWQKSYGGSFNEELAAMEKTPDGGYIIAGRANGNAFAMKINATGAVQWQKNYSDTQLAYDIQPTTDGGYIIAGDSRRDDHDGDYWIAKLDANGALIWEKIYGRQYMDCPNAIRQTTDGGYIVAGLSLGGMAGYNGGLSDIWVLKLDASGEHEWENVYGGSNEDIAYDIRQTTDGGYIITGTSNSNDKDLTGNKGNRDLWVLKLNNSGNKQWQKNLGGKLREAGGYVQQTNDGGYIIVCETTSYDGDINPAEKKGLWSIWAVKLSSAGTIQWSKLMGGPGHNLPRSVQQTTDNGYIIAALVGAASGGDISTYKGGLADVWLVKLKGTTSAENSLHYSNKDIAIYPNPAHDFINIIGESNTYIRLISIMSRDGKILSQININASAAKINIGHLASGNYLLKIETKEGESMIKQFVKP